MDPNERKRSSPTVNLEPLMPSEMGERAEQAGVRKAAMRGADMYGLAVLPAGVAMKADGGTSGDPGK